MCTLQCIQHFLVQTIITVLSIIISNVRVCLNVGLSRGSQKGGFKTSPEPYHAVRNDKIMLLVIF